MRAHATSRCINYSWLAVFAALLAGIAISSVSTGAAKADSARARACATMAPQSVAANSWAAARTQLVPPGATAVLICRYAGLNAHPRFALVGEAQVRVRVLTNELTREFDELPAWKPTIMIVCPDDRGTQITAQFSYPRGRAVTVASATSGCFNVSNGDISRAGGEFGRPVGPKLLKQLQSLSN